jgi:NitT/TauT family transport system substrate-binding protein
MPTQFDERRSEVTLVTHGSGARRARLLATAVVGALLCTAVFSGAAASAPKKSDRAMVTVTVVTLPIANALPMDLGIQKGFFAAEGIEITKRTLQSGNDVVLALANKNGDIGYLGWVPMMIARTQGIPFTAVAASEVEGTSDADNWQNILVRGNSSIRTPSDLAGKTVAVNALKGVGEVMIKAALRKRGVNPDSVRLLALPFPQMRSALNNGQVDAVWTPEPFLSQILSDGGRTVLAPGPVLGRFWPIGGYGALNDWVRTNAALAAKFRRAINRSLSYAQANPNEIRALLPAASRNVRLPIWSPLVDRNKLSQLAGYTRQYGVITTLPNLTAMVPSTITGGKNLQATVGNRFIALRLDGVGVKTLTPGRYTFVVNDTSKTRNFKLAGPGVNRATGVRGVGRATWTVTLKRGTYTFSSAGRPTLKRTFRVR